MGGPTRQTLRSTSDVGKRGPKPAVGVANTHLAGVRNCRRLPGAHPRTTRGGLVAEVRAWRGGQARRRSQGRGGLRRRHLRHHPQQQLRDLGAGGAPALRERRRGGSVALEAGGAGGTPRPDTPGGIDTLGRRGALGRSIGEVAPERPIADVRGGGGGGGRLRACERSEKICVYRSPRCRGRRAPPRSGKTPQTNGRSNEPACPRSAGVSSCSHSPEGPVAVTIGP